MDRLFIKEAFMQSSFQARCPHLECKDRAPQPQIRDRKLLRQVLENGKVSAVGIYCGHAWHLSQRDIENGQRAMDLGLL